MTLVKFQILPDNFVLEVHRLPDGRLETAKMGPQGFCANPGVSLAWLEKLHDELGRLFCFQFSLPPPPLGAHVLSSVEPDGSMLIWVRSKESVDVRLESPERAGLPAPADAAHDVIDVEVVSTDEFRTCSGIIGALNKKEINVTNSSPSKRRRALH